MGQLVCALFPWPGDQRSWISARRERGRGPAENTRSQEGTGVGRGGGGDQRSPFRAFAGDSQEQPGLARKARPKAREEQEGTKHGSVGDERGGKIQKTGR